MSNQLAVLERLPDRERNWLDGRAMRNRLGESLAPKATKEAWKYTPIGGFLDSFAADGAPGPAPAPQVIGLEQPGLTALEFERATGPDLALVRSMWEEHVDHWRYPLADLTLLEAGTGLLVKVDGAPPAPVTVTFASPGCQALLVDLAPGSNVTLVERVAAPAFSAQLVFVRVGAGARITHHRMGLVRDTMSWSLLAAELASDAAYTLRPYQGGGRRRRADTHFRLAGRGARTHVLGAFAVDDGGHLDQQLVVEHLAPDTESELKFHGIASGKSRAVFNGRIHIHPGARNSNAHLTNKNLALTPSAEIDTKPELEIYTDEVRCSHGATVGQLSADSLFYLRSRGVPEREARRLLCKGFLRECIEGPLAEEVTTRLLEALQ